MADDRKRTPLSRERVLAAALELADCEGLEAISMRRLGQALGVEAMSLYKHVTDKDEILDGIVERVLGQIDVPPSDLDWRHAMRQRAVSARAVFAGHPWAIGLLESRAPGAGSGRLGYFDAVLGALRGAGFSSQLAKRGFVVLDAYVHGYILLERSLSLQGDVVSDGYDPADDFTFGVDLILDALERRRAFASTAAAGPLPPTPYDR
jgi:AcrR family transcriptional regulator